jgi:hypothetical protein
MPSEWSLAPRGKKLLRVQFELWRQRSSEIVLQNLHHRRMSLVPTLVAQANSAKHHDWLVLIVQVRARIARFV